ncbi:MAG: type III pantothenate kinase [Candidatus Accumulibacter sp.]|jgi:type III pantothenate kinase|nr:type III pantothenate kinase [Accumulibacter sp.]
MIVAIDAGNSRIKWGVREGETWTSLGNLATAEAHRLAEAASLWPPGGEAVACCVAGRAAAEAIEAAIAASGRRLRWLRASASACGVRNGYAAPERLGADRWAALIGARGKTPGACLVVCVGTATTIDWLDAGGLFRGGLILPGLRLMCTALARDTAQLPYADGEFRAEPRRTEDAIVSGGLHAQAGAIERMFARVCREGEAVCLLTGGGAGRIAPCLEIPHRLEKTLVLDGLVRSVS